MARLRYNNQAGTLASLPLTSGGTTINFSAAPDFATITSPDYIPLTLDYGTANFEVVYLTAYTSGGTSGTITRAAEDSANWPAVAHNSTSGPGGGTAVWSVAPTISDFAGLPIVRKFPFAYNTASIATGASLYTPSVGDILLDAWVEIDTAWNGTTPLGDLAITALFNSGIYEFIVGSQLDMTKADADVGMGFPTGRNLGSLAAVQTLSNATTTTSALFTVPALGSDVEWIADAVSSGSRFLPFKFSSTNPVQFWVTQNGLNNGSATGATQGSAVLYLVTATPA